MTLQAVKATLEARNLSKSFKGRRVVQDVSLDVAAGEVVGLLGPNGAGRRRRSTWSSALLRLITGQCT